MKQRIWRENWRLALAVSVIATLILFRLPTGSRADGPIYTPDPQTPTTDAQITVESNNNGVTIYISITNTSSGGSADVPPAGSGTGGDSSGPSCTASVMDVGLGQMEWLLAESPLHPGDAPWTVTCDDGYFGVAWVPNETDPGDVK